MQTKLTKLLGIEYPIMQGGMAWISDASLAGAVSEAGGIGMIAAANAPVEYVRAQIRKAKEITNKPFGVNVMLLSPFAGEIAQLVVDEKVPVVTTGAGNPSEYMELWKTAGVKVLPLVASVAYAKRLVRMGADAIVAEGGESGGHIGEMSTMALLPQVVDAIDIPVVGAGGIGDGRGIAAAFMLGACGVQMGTRFMLCDECTVHDNYKDKIIAAKDTDSVVTGRPTGHPVRGLKNRLTREFNELEAKEVGLEAYEQLGADTLRKAAIDGDVRYGSVMAGQIAGMVSKRQSAKEMIEELVEETRRVLAVGLSYIGE